MMQLITIAAIVLCALLAGCAGGDSVAPEADFTLMNPAAKIVSNITIWYGILPIPIDVTIEGEAWLHYSHTNTLENGKVAEGEVAISLLNGTMIARNEESSLIDIEEEHIPAELRWEDEETLRIDVKEFDLTPLLANSLSEEDTGGADISVSPASFRGFIPGDEVAADLADDAPEATCRLNNGSDFKLKVAALNLVNADEPRAITADEESEDPDDTSWHKTLAEEPIIAED